VWECSNQSQAQNSLLVTHHEITSVSYEIIFRIRAAFQFVLIPTIWNSRRTCDGISSYTHFQPSKKKLVLIKSASLSAMHGMQFRSHWFRNFLISKTPSLVFGISVQSNKQVKFTDLFMRTPMECQFYLIYLPRFQMRHFFLLNSIYQLFYLTSLCFLCYFRFL